MSLSRLFQIAKIRVVLLLKQRLGWVSLVLGLGIVVFSAVLAGVSYVNPAKIFWDFSLAASFLLQGGLALFVGTQLFHDEKQRRTLHLLLSHGLSRREWLLGNALGVWISLVTMDVIWFLGTCAVGWLSFGTHGDLLILQCKLLQQVEVLVLLSFSMLFSLWMRPLVALFGALALTAFSHSADSIRRIFSDQISGRFVSQAGVRLVLWVEKFMPPLDWFNLRDLVGYESAISNTSLGLIVLVGLMWSAFFFALSLLSFEKFDL